MLINYSNSRSGHPEIAAPQSWARMFIGLELIRITNKTRIEIAALAGYRNHFYYIKAFKNTSDSAQNKLHPA